MINPSTASGPWLKYGLLLLIPALLSAADIRQFSWNDSLDRIESRESAPVVYRDADRIAYDVQVRTYRGVLLYQFVEEKLAAAAYDFELNETKKQALIGDYATLKAALNEKYGNPLRDLAAWKNSRYRSRPEKYGLAVSLGDVVCETTWETADTQIVLSMSRGPAHVSASVTYISKALANRLGQHTLVAKLAGDL